MQQEAIEVGKWNGITHSDVQSLIESFLSAQEAMAKYNIEKVWATGRAVWQQPF